MPLDAQGLIDAAADRALGERIYRCRACNAALARKSDLAPLRGDHEHVVFNPAGIVFRIWCFSHAGNLLPVGAPSAVFTWFKGYEWRIALCGECRTHVGWVYDGAGPPARFYGLISDRLAEGPAD